MNDTPKNQIVERLKQANNVLVTVSTNPSVDQLAACIGLTLLLNKLGKHGTAVFSGQIPSTIEFLKPEATLERNTDSLRDFIIALDKAKADKLRYKVEDKVVKIFITPYRTSITEKDLQFSQGDFNVDVVIALGVHRQQDLDQAITSHGRILHDATVISVNNAPSGELGSINWVDSGASSLCELVVSIGEALGGAEVLDAQMSTAFLTGIVAETSRFSNAKATPTTMAMTGRLMAAGASTQLIAAKLEEKPPEPPPVPPKSNRPKTPPPPKPGQKPEPTAPPSPEDGTIQIQHEEKPANLPPPAMADEQTEDILERIQIDNDGNLKTLDELPAPDSKSQMHPNQGGVTPSLITEPPTLGGTLTANTEPEGLTSTSDPMSLPSLDGPLLTHNSGDSTPDKPPQDTGPEETLEKIEETVESAHNQLDEQPATSSQLNSARDAVAQAIGQSPNPEPLQPIAALNAQPIDLNISHNDQAQVTEAPNPAIDHDQPLPYLDLPPHLVPPASSATDPTQSPQQASPGAPPPVPPPLMPPVL